MGYPPEPEFIPELRSLVTDFPEIWIISLQAGAHADLPPLEVKLKPDAVPVRVRVRRYSQEQRDFLSRFVAQLEAAGMVYKNPRAPRGARPRFLFLSRGRPNFISPSTFDLSANKLFHVRGLFLISNQNSLAFAALPIFPHST
jgi:hypothetical protein